MARFTGHDEIEVPDTYLLGFAGERVHSGISRIALRSSRLGPIPFSTCLSFPVRGVHRCFATVSFFSPEKIQTATLIPTGRHAIAG